MKKTQICVFVQNCKKTEMEIFAFCIITFEPIIILTRETPQNDFSFVKIEHTYGKKTARYGCKMVIYEEYSFQNSL